MLLGGQSTNLPVPSISLGLNPQKNDESQETHQFFNHRFNRGDSRVLGFKSATFVGGSENLARKPTVWMVYEKIRRLENSGSSTTVPSTGE